MRARRKRTVKVESNICIFELFLNKSRYHKQMIIMNKNLFGGFLILNLNNLISKLLINNNIARPILDTLILHIIKILEIMKQRSDVIFIKQQKWQSLLSCHKYRIGSFFFKLCRQNLFLGIGDVLEGRHEAYPFEVYLLLLDHGFQSAVHYCWVVEAVLDGQSS